MKDYLRREGLTSEAMLPTSLRLARETERLRERVGTLLSEQAVREPVDELNEQIAAYQHSPSPPFVSLRPVDAEAVVAHWRSVHEATAAERPTEPAPGLGRGGLRWLGRRKGR